MSSLEELAALVERVRARGQRAASLERIGPFWFRWLREFPLLATGKIHTSSLRQGDVTVVYEERL